MLIPSHGAHESVQLGEPAVWFPTIRTGTGTDMFTERLSDALGRRGIRSEITWLPLRAEYTPWSVPTPKAPSWANVVHVNSWLHRRFIPNGLPLVATLHSCIHDPVLNPYKTWLQKSYHRHWIQGTEKRTLERANAATAVSEYTAGRAGRIFQLTDIVPILNWLDTDRFQPDQRLEPKRPFRLLFSASLRKLKGVDLLPAIMARLGGNFELHYTGTEAEMSRYGIATPNMKPLGRIQDQEDLIRAYRGCDALLFPTRLEGFGLVALEALACGRPVIATDCTSLPEVVIHGESGILCPVDNVAAFADAAKTLGTNLDLWRRMCAAARRRAEMFSEERAISEYISLYNRLLNSGAGS